MNADEKRIAIAKACGWNHWFNGWNKLDDNTPPLTLTENLPDYLNDLNAIHEAEKVLTIDQSITYLRKLELVTHGRVERLESHTAFMKCMLLIHSTATQRAEAFIQTLNLCS